METLLVIITALVLVAALVWFCRRRIIQCPRHVIINRALLDEVKPQIKPGDLLLFSSYRYNFFTRTFGNAVFAHTGVVVEHNGALCAYEMVENDYTVLGADPSRDILITPLEDRIRNYPGNVFIASLKVPLTPAQRERLDEFVATRRYTFTKRWKLLALIPTRILLDQKAKSHRAIVRLCGTDVYYDPVHLVLRNFVRDLRNKNHMHIASYCDSLSED